VSRSSAIAQNPELDLEVLPTDRRVALRLLSLLNDPKAPTEELARVSSADPALTVRLLAAASTPFFGATKPTTTSRAVSLLGRQALRSLLSGAALQLFERSTPALPDTTWLHAISAGVASAIVAPHFGIKPAEALTTALVHDVGTMMLFNRDPNLFTEMETTEHQRSEDRIALEVDYFGVDHATLAAQVLVQRGVAVGIVEAIRGHHIRRASKMPPLARALCVGDLVADAIAQPDCEHTELDETLAELYLARASEALVHRTVRGRNSVIEFLVPWGGGRR
jgi:HD-like signal output (HDOD) protein